MQNQNRNESWKTHLVFSEVPKPYAIHMAQIKFEVTRVVSDNLHGPETAFVFLLKEDNWLH